MLTLTSVAAIKSYNPVNGSTDDALLTAIATAVNTMIPNYLNRELDSVARSEVLHGNGGQAILAPAWPITAIASLSVDEVAISPATLITDTGYQFHDRSIILRGGLRFTSGFYNVKLTYTAGYSSAPSDLAQAATELAALIYKDRDRVGLTSKSVAGEVIGLFNRDIPSRIKAMLQPYKNVVPL